MCVCVCVCVCVVCVLCVLCVCVLLYTLFYLTAMPVVFAWGGRNNRKACLVSTPLGCACSLSARAVKSSGSGKTLDVCAHSYCEYVTVKVYV